MELQVMIARYGSSYGFKTLYSLMILSYLIYGDETATSSLISYNYRQSASLLTDFFYPPTFF